MTLAVTVKVYDGVVLAADSASSIIQEPFGSVSNVYYNANKIFNLCKGVPLAAMTWGGGSIGNASISAIVKDFRSQISAENLLRDGYSVKDIATRFRDFVLALYTEAFGKWLPENKPYIGFIVTGYSTGSSEIEEYQIDIVGETSFDPLRLEQEGETGVVWRGQIEAISRLILGYSPMLQEVLQENLGVEQETSRMALQLIRKQLEASLVSPAMPVQDAVDLAKFLVDLAINYSRFMPGAQIVGGPIEIATVTKHEGFKWVSRKHYYRQEINI